MKLIYRALVLIGLAVIVGLQLYNNSEETRSVLDRAERSLTAVPVTTFTVTKKSPTVGIRTAGIVASESEVVVVSQVSGQVLRVTTSPGRSVKTGELMVEVDAFFTRQELEIADEAYRQQLKDLNRYESLSADNAIPAQQLEQLKLQLAASKTKVDMLKRRLRDSQVTAPIAGIVNQLFIKKGQSLGPGSPVAEIVNEDLLTIKASLFRDDLDLIANGATVQIETDYGTIEGRVSSIGVKPDVSGKYPIEVAIERHGDTLKPGMIVTMSASVALDQRVMIPERALVMLGGVLGVFKSIEGHAHFQEVRTGRYFDDEVELLAGVQEGDQLLLTGNQLVRDGESIKVTE